MRFRFRVLSLVLMVVLLFGMLGTVATAEKIGTPNETYRPAVRASEFAVATNHPLATAAANQILLQGGNAFDAAVAGLAALGVVEPSHSSLGGEVFMLLYPQGEGKVVAINGGGTAPKSRTIDYMLFEVGEIPSDGIYSTVLPGAFSAWIKTLQLYGTMSLADVLAPAIKLAEEGHPLSDLMAERFAGSKNSLAKFESSVKAYFRDGDVPKAGDIFVQPQLARTMKRLVEAERAALHKGRVAALQAAHDYFYAGPMAQEMVEFSKSQGGDYTLEDFASYEAEIEEPAMTTYRGYEVYKNASSNQGPFELMILNILENFDLKAMGHNSPEYVYTFLEAINLAAWDREWLADWNFVDLPLKGLLSKERAAERAKLINPDKALLDYPIDNPWKYEGRPMPEGAPDPRLVFQKQAAVDFDTLIAQIPGEDPKANIGIVGNTSYVCVVDKWRNAASFTPSLYSGFGSKMAVGELGFVWNNRGTYFWLDENHPNRLEGGKRPRNTISPSMALKDGEPFLAYGTPCGDCQPQSLAQMLVNIVDFDMGIQQAIEAPKFKSSAFPGSSGAHSWSAGAVQVEGRMPAEVVSALEAKGFNVRVYDAFNSGFGGANGILIYPNGGLAAGSDPRREGYSMGW